jgi:hypothetical protein
MEGIMRLRPFTTTAICGLLIALGIGLARPAWASEIRVLNATVVVCGRLGAGRTLIKHAVLCGTAVPQVAWTKLRALRDGAAIASKKLRR